MKKVLALLLTVFLLFGTFALCSNADAKQYIDGEEPAVTRMTFGNGPVHINLMSYSNEVAGMVQNYIKRNPEFGRKYTVSATIVPTDGGQYQSSLDAALKKNDVDMYVAEQAFITKYVSGDMSEYAASYYELGLETDDAIRDAQIAQYIVDVGTRRSDGNVVALAYQASGCALIYRASIAKEVFGTDDPDVIEKEVGGGTGRLDDFWNASIKLGAKGYPIVSSIDDIWRMVEYNSSSSWVSGKTVTVSPEKLAYFDYAKAIRDRGWSNETGQWSTGWYNDMGGKSQDGKSNKPAFCFIGPAWLMQFVMVGYSEGNTIGQGTYGDWRVCQAPQKAFWGGTWLFSSRRACSDLDKRAGMAELINWITLDTSKSGLQYLWANGQYDGTKNVKDTVASAKVMSKSDGQLDYLGGQDMYPTFIKANEGISGQNVTSYDDAISSIFKEAVHRYAFEGESYAEAIKYFQKDITSDLGFNIIEVADRPTVVIPDMVKEPGNTPDTSPDEPVEKAGNSMLLIIICIAAGAVLIIAGLIVTIVIIVNSKKKKAKAQPAALQYPVQPAALQQPQAAPQQLQYPAQAMPPVQPAAVLQQPQTAPQPVIPAAPVSSKSFCPFCGAELNSGERFCGRCGGKLK